MADIDIDELIRQFGNNYPKWVNDAIGSRLENTNKLLKELQKQKTASNPEFKKEVDNRKQINKELVAEKKLVEAQNKSLKETNDLYKNLKQNLGGLVKNIDKFKKDLDSMSAQSNTKELVKQSKELTKETAARKELTKTVDRQTINQVTYILTQKELNKTTRILDKQFGGLSKTIDVLVKKISSSDISNQKPVDVDFTAFNKSMMSFQTQMDGVIKKQDEFAKKIQRITSSINEPVNPNNTSGNTDAERGYKKHIDNASKSLKNFNENVNQSAQSLGESIQSMSTLSGVSSVAAGAIGGLASKIPLLGIFAVALGAGIGHVIDEMLIARTAFSQLSTNGFGLGTDLIGLSRIARDGKMSIEDFQTAIAQNKAAFMALGPDAAQIFSKLQADAKETGSLFKKFGMSLDETTEFLSDNLEYQRSTGRLRDMSDVQRSMMADQELMRLAKVSATFGKSVKEITAATSDYMKSYDTVANIIQITQGMQNEDRQRVMGDVFSFKETMAGQDISPEMQQFLMQAVQVQVANREGRPLLDAESQKMAQLMQQIPELDAYVKQTVSSGKAPEDFAANVVDILQTQFESGDGQLVTEGIAAKGNRGTDAEMVAFSRAALQTIGNTFGFDREGVQSRIENTEALRDQVDPALDAINSAEIAINEVQNTYKQVLMELFGSDTGTKITEAITSKITGATENIDGFMNNILDPNYTGQPLDNITELLTGKESVGDLSASDINTDKLAMVAAGYKLGGPLGAIAAMFMGDDAIKKGIESALEFMGASGDVQSAVSPYAEKMILYGIVGSKFGLKGAAVGAVVGAAHASIGDAIGAEIKYDEEGNVTHDIPINPATGMPSGSLMDNIKSIFTSEGATQSTTQGTRGLMSPESDAKDSYEMFAQAHHDIMAPVFRELHADTMKNLFIKNTDAIDTIFTKSLDKFLYTKSSIESIITASKSEQGLSPTQIKQLEVMGMGSMNSGGLIPMEARIGGTTGTSIGGLGNRYMPPSSAEFTGEFGQLSSKYESRGDPTAIGFDRKGGHSYGKYQIATRTGTFDSYMEHLKKNNPETYELLSSVGGSSAAMSGSQQFKKAWSDIMQNEEHAKTQRQFIQMTHFLPAKQKIEKELGLDMDSMSQTLNDVLVSTQVQHGAGGATSVFKNALSSLGGQITSESDFIDAIYNERAAGNGMKYFKQSTANVRESVVNRFASERQDALAMVKQEMGGESKPVDGQNGDVDQTRSLANGQLPTELLRSSDRMTADTMSGILRVASPDLAQEAPTKLLRSQHRSQADTISSVLETANNVTRPVARPNKEMTQQEADRLMADYYEQLGLLKQQFENPDLTTEDKIPITAELTEMLKSMPEIPEHLASEKWLNLSGNAAAHLSKFGQPVQNEQVTRPVARPNRDGTSAEASMSEVEKLRQAKLQAATMDPDRNEPIQMKYTTSEEEAKEKDRMKAMGASNKEVYDDHILRELRQITNETKRARRATEKNGSGLAPGSPAC